MLSKALVSNVWPLTGAVNCPPPFQVTASPAFGLPGLAASVKPESLAT